MEKRKCSTWGRKPSATLPWSRSLNTGISLTMSPLKARATSAAREGGSLRMQDQNEWRGEIPDSHSPSQEVRLVSSCLPL